MKLVKCGKRSNYNYCITQQLAKRGLFKRAFYELFLDVTDDVIMQKWFKIHANDDDIQCQGISYGVVSVCASGKPKTKFKDHLFARFRLQTSNIKEVMEYADSILSKIYQFKMMADIEGINIDDSTMI